MVQARLSQFKARQDANDLTLSRNNKSNAIEFKDNSGENTMYIADAQFNDKLGILSIIKQNGDILEVGGFLTQDQLGKGPRGERGINGKNGRDGRAGKDGGKGETGCPGEVGPKGKKGRHGIDGTDGPVGIPGKTGCEGPTGDPGQVGDKGDQGLKGELGRQGISCIAGPIGPQGPKPRSYAHIGEDEPGPEFNLWAVPFVDELPVLEDPDGLTINVNDISVSMVQVNGDKYGAVASHIIESIDGLRGNAVIEWSGDYENDGRISSTISPSGKNLELDVLAEIEKSKSLTVSGKATITVRDTYDDKTATKVVNYSFTGNNGQVVPQNLKGTAVDSTVIEGGMATFTLNLNQPAENDVLVTLSFTGATTRMSDNRSTSGIISAGESSISFTRETIYQGGIQDNNVIHGIFASSGISEETPGSMTGDVTITESINATTVSVSDKTLNETDGSKAYNVPVSLTSELEGSGSLDYELVDGTAVYNSEYNSTYGKTRTLNFSASYQTLNIPITVLGDNVNEGNTQFKIKFSNVSSNLNLNKNEITITIKEDDTFIGGGGGGCLLLGTPVDTPDGPVKAELLSVGDVVTSRFIKGMPDASQGEDYNHWSTSELEAAPATSRVEYIKIDKYHSLMTINDLMITPDHPILVRREGRIFWQPAGLVNEGDFVEVYNGWQEVRVARMQSGEFDVVTLDVEPHDVYYANGILVHNAENSLVNKD